MAQAAEASTLPKTLGENRLMQGALCLRPGGLKWTAKRAAAVLSSCQSTSTASLRYRQALICDHGCIDELEPSSSQMYVSLASVVMTTAAARRQIDAQSPLCIQSGLRTGPLRMALAAQPPICSSAQAEFLQLLGLTLLNFFNLPNSTVFSPRNDRASEG